MELSPPPSGSPGRAGSVGVVRSSPHSLTTIGATAEGQGSGQIALPHSYLYLRSVTSFFRTCSPFLNVLYRLSLFTLVFLFVWFVTATVFVYKSVNTCRFSSPHLWWLTFGIFFTPYLFLLGLLRFILGPVIYVRSISFWSVRF